MKKIAAEAQFNLLAGSLPPIRAASENFTHISLGEKDSSSLTDESFKSEKTGNKSASSD